MMPTPKQRLTLLHARCRFKEPPLEWLVSVSRRACSIYSICGMLNFLCRIPISIRWGANLHALMLLAVAGFHFVFYCITNGLIFGDSIRTRHYALTSLFVTAAFVGIQSCGLADDYVFRHRSFGMGVVVWRVMVPIFGLRMLQCVICLVVVTFFEIYTTVGSAIFFNELVGIERVVLNLVVSSVLGLGWSYAWISWRYDVYKTVKQMEVEKEACHSILTMLCDATFWVAGDGDTLLVSDSRLEALLGKGLQGKLLSDFIPEAERDRFHDLVRRKDGSLTRQVPITLTSSQVTSGTFNADLLIVDRRDALEEHAETEMRCEASSSAMEVQLEPCFLIGLRVGSDIEHLATEMIVDAADETAAKVEHLASMVRNSDCPTEAVVQKTVKEPSVVVDGCSQVLCQDSDGSYQLKDILEVKPGEKLVCVDCFGFDLCTETVQEIHKEKPGFCIGFGKKCQVPVHGKLVSKRPQDTSQKWRSVHGTAASANMLVQLLSFGNAASLSELSRSWDKLQTDGHKWSNCLMSLRLANGSRGILMHTALGRFVALGAPSQVRFVNPSDGLSSFGTESSACQVSMQRETPTQLLSLGKWEATGKYFEHCALSLLEDIVDASNFSGCACCTWHLNSRRLSSAVDQLLARQCPEPRKEDMTQCSGCNALHRPGDQEEYCWLCNGPKPI